MTGGTAPATEAGRLMRMATYAAVVVALTLIVVKTGAWLATGSVTVLSSLLDSLLDALASLINLVAVRQALVPADAEHRFGHGKAEPLAALAQSAFVGGSGILILLEAVSRLFDPKPVDNAVIGIGVMVFSVMVTVGLLRFQSYVVRRSSSVALSAWFGISWIDPLFGAGIAAYLMKTAIGIGREALDMLMDRELPDEDRQRILAIVRAHPQVKDVRDLRTRGSGLQIFIQLHMILSPTMTLADAHAVADAVEAKLLEAYPGAEILIHQEPAEPIGTEAPP
jgi:ferrous-iron efflux pump FieF